MSDTRSHVLHTTPRQPHKYDSVTVNYISYNHFYVYWGPVPDSRVVLEVGVRGALPAPALVEEDDAVHRGVEVPPHVAVGAPAGAPVQEDHRLALGVA